MNSGKQQEAPPADAEKATGSGTTEQGAASDPVNQARILGNMLDGLVRSCRADSSTVDSIAERLMERWKSNSDIVFRFDATSLFSEEQEVLSAEEEDGLWLLPAFMAGMKSLSLTPLAASDDLVRLATELGALGPNLTSIRKFRDWLWSEGAEGFDVVLDFGFSEGLDTALMDAQVRRDALAAVRADAAASLSMDVRILSSQELDVAAVRDEFQMTLDAFSREVHEEAPHLDDRERQALRSAFEDSLFWVDAQVYLALAHPELHSQIPPERMARRVMELMASGVALRFLGFLAHLATRR